MKYIIEFILIVIVIFFVWNILKRLFFKTFYQFPNAQNQAKDNSKEKINSGKHGLNWDAETVDYEEVKEENKKGNK